MSDYAGDFVAGDTVRLRFNTRKADGTPITLGGTPAVSVYKQGSTTESTAGVTLTTDYDSRTGYHSVSVDTSADGTFYATGNDFFAVITTGTVDGVSVVGSEIGRFSIGNRVTRANVIQILGTLLTETVAGYLAAAFKKLFDVAAPVFTAASVNQSADNNTILANATYGNAALKTALNTKATEANVDETKAFAAAAAGSASSAAEGIAELDARIPDELVDGRMKADATVDTQTIAAAIIAALAEDGVTVGNATTAFLNQLAARTIVVNAVTRSAKDIDVHVGGLHSAEAGTAWEFTDQAGAYPHDGEWWIEVRDATSTAVGSIAWVDGELTEPTRYRGEMTAAETGKLNAQGKAGTFYVLQRLTPNAEPVLRWHGKANFIAAQRPES